MIAIAILHITKKQKKTKIDRNLFKFEFKQTQKE
jgi:hypothetical protein